MNDPLIEMRAKLLQINLELFSLIEKRKLIVTRIQDIKMENNLSVFSPEREKDLFEKLAPLLKKLTLKELLSFSLLLEAHADPTEKNVYPAFSEMIHLRKTTKTFLWYRVNPILLYYYDAKSYFKLPLKTKFNFFEKP